MVSSKALQNERVLTAYHEAGHVVLAHALGYTYEDVWILPDGDPRYRTRDPGDVLGKCELSAGFWSTLRSMRAGLTFVKAMAQREIDLSLAGIVAERKYAGVRSSSYRNDNDTRHAVEVIRMLSQSIEVDAPRTSSPSLVYRGERIHLDQDLELSLGEFWTLHASKARLRLFRGPAWRAVEAVAAALLKYDRLHGHQAFERIQPHVRERHLCPRLPCPPIPPAASIDGDATAAD